MAVYYTVGELAKTYGIPISTLRFYDKHGIFVPEYRNPETGYRYYSAEQLILFDVILFLRELDVPTGKIPEMLENAHCRADLLDALRAHRAEVAERVEQLTAIRGKLDAVTQFVAEFDFTTGVLCEKDLPARRVSCKDASRLPAGGAERRFVYKQIVGSTTPPRLDIPVELISMGAISSWNEFRRTGEPAYTYQFNEVPPEGALKDCTPLELPAGRYLTLRFCNTTQERSQAYSRMLRHIEENKIPVDDRVIETYIGVGMPPVTIGEEIIELQALLL